jgi:large subunit ribosomal protein L24e
MVVKRQCSFCASEIEPGTGTMFVKRDGTVFHFCTSSCRKQQLELGRVGHRFKWTRAHALKRAADRSSAERAGAAASRAAAASAPAPKAPPAPAAPAGPAETPVEPAAAAPAKKPRARKKPAAPSAE